MVILRVLAQCAAYMAVLALSLSWLLCADRSANASLLDLATVGAGDAILRWAGVLGIGPAETLKLARALVATKAAIGILLLAGLVAAASRRWRREADYALLEVGLFVSAFGSAVAMSATMSGGQPMQGLIGELILCIAASELLRRAGRAGEVTALSATLPRVVRWTADNSIKVR